MIIIFVGAILIIIIALLIIKHKSNKKLYKMLNEFDKFIILNASLNIL